MYAAIIPALVTCGVALLLASLILARGERAPIHWVYLGLLLSIATWTSGAAWRFTHVDDAGVRQGLNLIYLGLMTAPPLWFWLTALYTRSPVVDSQLLRAVSFLVPVFAYLSWWTNDHHGLFASQINHAALMAGPRVWAGPAFWMNLTWILAFAVGGVWLVLAHAWRLRGTRERRRSLELAVALLAPLLLSQVYVFRLLPIPYDLTPTGLCVTVLIFYGLVTRKGIFEVLPLVRRDVLEHLHEGVLLANPSGLIVDVNPAGREILGIAGEASLGESLAGVLAAAAVERSSATVATEVERVRRDGSASALRFETGAGRRIELSVAPVQGGSGEPAGLFAVLRDRTEEHRHELMLRQSQKLESVGVLAAGMAHEVNNPLAFIQANLGVLQSMAQTIERNRDRLPEKDARDLDEMREVLDDSLEGIARISRIVNRLRRFSRSAEEGADHADPNAAAEEAVRFAQLDRQDGWRVDLRLTPGLPPVQGSRDGIIQVLLNLLLNAIQAVAGLPDGRITVASRRVGDDVEVVVCDNGTGVPEGMRERIFDPFFTTKPPDQGTGLGLSIAYDIARENGGRLTLGEGDGTGAAFRLTLPIANA